MAAWGGDAFWYFPQSEMGWFLNMNKEGPVQFKFHDYVFSENMTKDSLSYLKNLIQLSYNNDFPIPEKDSLELKIVEMSGRLRQHYIADRPFHYYFTSHFLRMKHFLAKNSTQDWPGVNFKNSPFVLKVLKLTSLMEYALVLLSIPVLTFMFFRNSCYRSPLDCFLILNIWLLIITFSFIIDLSHFSYFMTGFAAGAILLCKYLPPFKKHLTASRPV